MSLENRTYDSRRSLPKTRGRVGGLGAWGPGGLGAWGPGGLGAWGPGGLGAWGPGGQSRPHRTGRIAASRCCVSLLLRLIFRLKRPERVVSKTLVFSLWSVCTEDDTKSPGNAKTGLTGAFQGSQVNFWVTGDP